jgi:hypothetical protein
LSIGSEKKEDEVPTVLYGKKHAKMCAATPRQAQGFKGDFEECWCIEDLMQSNLQYTSIPQNHL